jgi:hypothetical protein
MSATQGSHSDWETIASQLPAGWKELATKMQLIRPQPAHMGAKITDIEQVLRLVLYHASGASLRLTTAVGAVAGIVSISAVALHKWMKKLGPYLSLLLQRMVHSAAYAPERWAGFHIIVADATTVQRPGSKGTTARVHYALRLADVSSRHIEVTDDQGGETLRRFCPAEGELWIADRVYANPPGVAWVRKQRADVIVRFNRGSLPLYNADRKHVDVNELLDATHAREIAYECLAYVHGPDHDVISGRLCWLRLPEKKAARAQERLRRETDRTCDDDALRFAEFVVVFTTTGASQLSAAQVLELYRARWQVELEFKRDKSLGELDQLPNFLPETIYSWICAKLLLKLIAHKIASQEGVFPPGGVRLILLPPIAKDRAEVRRAHC